MKKNLARVSAFILVAGSKTIYNAGQACLTIDATVVAIYCLSHYYDKPGDRDKNVEVFNIGMQVFAASISTMVVAWSRYPAIWHKLSLEGVKAKYRKLKHELKGVSRIRRFLFMVIAAFGILSCVARGLSAYLGTEVIFRERFNRQSIGVDFLSGAIGITVTVSAFCFNLSNMLTAAAKDLKEPSFVFSFKMLFRLIAVFTGAVVTRFFIKEFLDRRGATETGQVIAQSFFFLAQFVMDWFTMGSSLEENWCAKAKNILKSSAVLSGSVLTDAFSTWLGLTSITLYSILTDVFITKAASGPDKGTLCPVDQTSTKFALHCWFIGLALVAGIPIVISYFNYLLSHTKKGYDSMVRFFKSPCCMLSSDEAQPLLSEPIGINITPELVA